MNWWHHYNRFSGEAFPEFWTGHLASQRKILFVVGLGFDPRALQPLGTIVGLFGSEPASCIAINFSSGFTGDAQSELLRNKNKAGLEKLFAEKLDIRELEPNDSDGIRSISRNTITLLGDVNLSDYSDIVVDISSLPRIIYLTLLNNFLGRLIQPSAERPLASETNLHVIFAESASLDAKIGKKELEPELATIQGLSVRLDEETADAWPKIWFPVLGEGNREALDRIHTQIDPDDVCPILPLQTRDARRADNIVGEVGELLFDRFKVDPRDLIYATEDNPFQLYRNLLAAMQRYEDSLAELGGVRFILSPLSSKGLSIGALLACYENKTRITAGGFNVRTGFAYIETSRYEAASLTGSEGGTPVSLWLTGSCYAL
ncbi:hypothetical protein [Rhizobium leguminosarum]|uniref:hypothetical protein n=1 Tax=Rhizobium leguminosarum TaxID=384 RepID=UPI00040A9CAC|nr:hypothetical protein [Rhizobium leguminosarum]